MVAGAPPGFAVESSESVWLVWASVPVAGELFESPVEFDEAAPFEPAGAVGLALVELPLAGVVDVVPPDVLVPSVVDGSGAAPPLA